MSAWAWVAVAVVFEAAWVIGLRFVEGWTRPIPSAAVALAYTLALVPLGIAARTLPNSLLYAVWVGGGIVLVFAVDALYFRVPLSVPKLACVALILCGAVGLKLLSPVQL